MGNPRKTLPLYLPQVVTLPVFFIGLTLLPPSPLVVYRKAWTGSPGSACFLASRGYFPKKIMETRVGVSVVAIKNARGYRAERLARGATRPQKRPGVILRKGLLGVDGLPKKAACLPGFR